MCIRLARIDHNLLQSLGQLLGQKQLSGLYPRLQALLGQIWALVDQFLELNRIGDEAADIDLPAILCGDSAELVRLSTELGQLCAYDMAWDFKWLLN